MTTSAEDLARFVTALFNGTILKPATQAEMLKPVLPIRSLHEFPIAANEAAGEEAGAVGLAYGVGWGLLTHSQFGPAFFKEGMGMARRTISSVSSNCRHA